MARNRKTHLNQKTHRRRRKNSPKVPLRRLEKARDWRSEPKKPGRKEGGMLTPTASRIPHPSKERKAADPTQKKNKAEKKPPKEGPLNQFKS